MVTSARSLNSTAKRGADQSTSASARMIFCFLCFLVALPDHFMQLCDRFVNPADLIDDPFFDGLFSDENGSEVFGQHTGIEHQFFEAFSFCIAMPGNKA